jgi:predicted NBD/HSP70 family sugar kinase
MTDAGAAAVPARQHTIRAQNLGLVLRQIAADPGRSRAQLAQATGLTRTTISALVDELIERDLVAELTPGRGARGRPASPLVLNRAGPAGLGIEINVDYLAGCVVDLTGTVRAHRTVVSDNRAVSPRIGLRRATRLATNLPGWQGTRCAAQLQRWLGRPVTVDNEANLAALAQLWHDGAVSDFVLISGEIGVGAGLVMDGRLFRGVRGLAGEFGHVVIHPDGPPCGCGANGCLEQFAGQEALLDRAGLLDQPDPGATRMNSAVAALVDGAGRGEQRTRRALAEAGRALGIALADLINTVDIPTVVLGGLYARLGEWLVAPIWAELERRVISANWAPPTVLISALGTDAAVRGAAGVAVSQILDGATAVG